MTTRFVYNAANKGACCTKIEIELEGDIVKHVHFTDGCHGNHQGIESLSRGRTVADLIACMQGIRCRNGTSCPDQLARALKEVLANQKPDATK